MDTKSAQEFYRFKINKWVGPWYYDYPDGEDLLGKLTFCGEAAFLISAPFGILNAYVRHPIPTSQVGRFMRLAGTVAPSVGMAMAFAVGTYYATRLRGKDDAVNYALGGLAAAVAFGAAKGFGSGCAIAPPLAGLAALTKYQTRTFEGNLMAKKRHFSPYISRNKDFSGIPNKPNNWVKALPPEN